MPISVQPLVIAYSFDANRTQATDRVDLATLDAAFAAINAKLTEIINAVNTIQRDDDQLSDQSIELENLSDEVIEYLTSQINATVEAMP